MLSEIAGPQGRVVGIDLSSASLNKARSVNSTLSLDNVELLTGDLNARTTEGLSGRRFDLAFTRCFLIHQPDPTHTLRRSAELLHSGGWLVIQEPLRNPPPRSWPQCNTLTTCWELIHQVIESAGVPRHAVDDLQACARVHAPFLASVRVQIARTAAITGAR